MTPKPALRVAARLLAHRPGEWLLSRVSKAVEYCQGIGFGHERQADRAVLALLRERNESLCIFDGGANRGEFTSSALAILPPRQLAIHAFEPSAAAFRDLSSLYAGRERITLNNLALGNECGEAALYHDEPGSELGSLYPRGFTRHESVGVVTIDEYCRRNKISRIHLLKLDIEGHELQALRGASGMFANGGIEMVSFEFGGCNIDSRTFFRDFYEFFKGRNMRLARVTAAGKLHEITGYSEELERFRTTCFIAYRA